LTAWLTPSPFVASLRPPFVHYLSLLSTRSPHHCHLEPPQLVGQQPIDPLPALVIFFIILCLICCTSTVNSFSCPFCEPFNQSPNQRIFPFLPPSNPPPPSPHLSPSCFPTHTTSFVRLFVCNLSLLHSFQSFIHDHDRSVSSPLSLSRHRPRSWELWICL